jgi:DNA-binding transcriptional LysR family regulator
MIAEALTLDQLQVFLAVADSGSFSAAARVLNRAQSAITYAIQKLEGQIGSELFDRTAYRPTLSDAGRALLPRARRIAEEIGQFRVEAAGLAGGLEAELAIVIDSMIPMDCFIESLRLFQTTFPSVRTRIYVESLGATAEQVLSGQCQMGLALALGSESELLRRTPVSTVQLSHVAAACHPLAHMTRELTADDLKDEIQMVLTDRSSLTAGHDYGVFSSQTWRLADLGAKHALLRAGLGWGSMPRHMVEEDLAAGRLVELQSRLWGAAAGLTLAASLIWRFDTAFGVAGHWLRERLSTPHPQSARADAE